MEKLAFILKNIKNRTGIDVSCFSEDMSIVFTEQNKPVSLPDKTDFSQVYRSEKQNRTYFKFRFYDVNFVGSVSGVDKQSENYAYLIASLIENYSEDIDYSDVRENTKKIALGHISSRNVERFLAENSIKDGYCFCLAVTKDRLSTLPSSEYLEKTAENNGDLFAVIDQNTCVYIKTIGEGEERVSKEAFAVKLFEDVYKKTGEKVLIGVGTYKQKLYKADISFKEALAAMKMNAFLYDNSSVHSYTDFVVIRLLEDLPKYKLKEVKDVLLCDEADSVFCDEEMLRTAAVLMENDLNISEASRELYMHRNTLTYRLDKIQRETNLDIRRFSDAVIFRMLSVIKKITD